MNYQGKKVVGIWIDHKHARIITTPERLFQGEYGVIQKIESQKHAHHAKNENSHNKQESQDLHHMFEEVSHVAHAFDAIYITGPGTAQEELKNYLHGTHRFEGKEIVIGTSDHPTDHQMIAEVRDHFSNN